MEKAVQEANAFKDKAMRKGKEARVVLSAANAALFDRYRDKYGFVPWREEYGDSSPFGGLMTLKPAGSQLWKSYGNKEYESLNMEPILFHLPGAPT